MEIGETSEGEKNDCNKGRVCLPGEENEVFGENSVNLKRKNKQNWSKGYHSKNL